MASRYLRATGNWNGPVWAATAAGTPGSAATPTASDDIYLAMGLEVALTADAECSSILNSGPPVSPYGHIQLDGFDLHVLGNATSEHNITGSGTLTVDGNYTAYSDSGNFPSLIILNTSGNRTFTTNGHVFNDVRINMSGTGETLNITGSPGLRLLDIRSANSAAHTVNFEDNASVTVDKFVGVGSSSVNRLTIGASDFLFWNWATNSSTSYGQNLYMKNVGHPNGGISSVPSYIGSTSSADFFGPGGWLEQDPPKISTLVDPLTTAPGSNTNWTVTGTVSQVTTGHDGGGYSLASGAKLTSTNTFDLLSSTLSFQTLASTSLKFNVWGYSHSLVANKFYRLSLTGTTYLFQSSDDGASWTNVTSSTVDPNNYRSMRIGFDGAGVVGSINPTMGPPDFDIIHTLTYASSGGADPIRLHRGFDSAHSGTVYYRAGTSGAWTSLSVSGYSTTFPITSTTMQIAHNWNKSGNDYMTPSFENGTMTGIAISQNAVLSGIMGNSFMAYYAHACSNLTTLEVPDISGLTSAGDEFMLSYADACFNLTTLSVPDTSGLTSVGNYFMNYYAYACSGLTTIEVPDISGLTSAGDSFMYGYAYGCSGLTTLAVPDTSGLTSVGDSFMYSYAYDCFGLTTLAIPDTSGLTSVGSWFMVEYAYNCSSLTQLNLPKAGWFKTNNVNWYVPSGRLGILKGNTTTETDQADWQALTTSGKTLYTNYIRSAGNVLLSGAESGAGNFLQFFLGGN